MFLTVKEVERILCVKQDKAYEIIRNLNEELKQKGYLTIRGKINEEYLYERFKIKNNK